VTDENRALAYNIVRSQLRRLLNGDASEVLQATWQSAREDEDMSLSSFEDKVLAVAFEVSNLVQDTVSELNQYEHDEGLM
jgi:hypothetical protein